MSISTNLLIWTTERLGNPTWTVGSKRVKRHADWPTVPRLCYAAMFHEIVTARLMLAYEIHGNNRTWNNGIDIWKTWIFLVRWYKTRSQRFAVCMIVEQFFNPSKFPLFLANLSTESATKRLQNTCFIQAAALTHRFVMLRMISMISGVWTSTNRVIVFERFWKWSSLHSTMAFPTKLDVPIQPIFCQICFLTKFLWYNPA